MNLVDKTSIKQLASVLKKSNGLISVDTGTMHLGCALGIPTIAVFYEQTTISNWAPRKELYNSTLISQDQTAENILSAFKNLTMASIVLKVPYGSIDAYKKASYWKNMTIKEYYE